MDEAEINKNVKVNFSLVGDLGEILRKLNPKLEKTCHPEWMKEIERLKSQYPLRYDRGTLTCPLFLLKVF